MLMLELDVAEGSVSFSKVCSMAYYTLEGTVRSSQVLCVFLGALSETVG